MRLTPWLSPFLKLASRKSARALRTKRFSGSEINRLESLEDRLLLTVPVTYVDQNADFVVTTNNAGGAGADPGDIVTWNGDTTVTGLVFGTDAFDTIPNGITGADSGGTVKVATGEYRQAGVMNITKSVTIVGVGTDVDDVLIQRTGLRGGNEQRVIEVSAPNVTISHLKIGGWQNAPTVGELGQGYNVWTTQAFTKLDQVNLFGDDLRVGVYFGTSNDFTFTNSRITGTYFRMGIRGGAERMNISYNSFEESHYIHGPIYFEYGAPTSGSIDHNYFVSRVGVNNDALGDFKSDGTELYAITNYQPNVTAAAGLKIEYNTFIYQDAGLLNAQGASPNAVGVYIDPALTPSGPITIENNIFQGYEYTASPVPYAPVFRPVSGQFGGALEFDGVNDFAAFQSSTFDVGEKGTLNFWVKMDNPGKRNQFFEGPGNGGFEMQYRTSSGGQFYGRVDTVGPPAGGDFVIRSGGDSTTAWVNLQYTWDFNAAAKMRIYINGVESGYLAGFTPTDLAWSQIIDTTEDIMNVGRDLGDASRFFDGLMDDVAWYNEVLTGPELAAIRSAPAGDSSISSLIAYWNMDDAIGTLIVPGDAGTSIPLYLGASPLPVASATIGPVGTFVDYNLFYDNDQEFNSAPTDGGNNLYGDPRFVGMGVDPEDYYTLKFGSPAINASSDFPSDNEHRHIGAFQGVPVPPANIVYVDDDWAAVNFGDDPDGPGPALFFGVDSFATVQEAVNLVETDGTIIVYAGTYAENVSINKNVTIDGDGPDDTFINGGAGFGISIVDPTTDVTLKDLKITGTPTALSNTATAADLILDTVVLINNGGATTVYGSDSADLIELRNIAGTIEIQINTGGWTSIPTAGPLTIEGLDGSDVFSIAYAVGFDPIPTAGLVFNGGTGLSDKMELKVLGDVNYTPSATTMGNGVVTVGGKTITFTGLEPVDFDFIGPGVFTLTLPGAADIVNIANGLTVVGGLDALVLSGSSNAVAFETAHVRDATSIVIDTTAVAGTDLVTISSASNAHNNGALTIDAGAETSDVINVNGTTTFAGTTTLDASTINLNANVTNVITGTTATIVNVNNNVAQIQDGVDVALAGATVNVAGGFTYAEAVSVAKNLSLVAVGAANANISAVTGPALTSSGATVNLTGFNATTSAATSTILVTAGSLKLRQNSIVKSGAAPGASLIATGAGVLNLGANPVAGTADPGQNSITGAGALVNSATAVDASGNWWGTTVQATIGTMLTANVDYSPFLNSGTDIAPATPGFQSSLSDITVHTAGPQTGPDPRITEGYNTLAASGTIHVLTGTYTENVDLGALPVDKAVTFAAGASPGQVAIMGNITFTSNDTLPVELNGLSTALFDNFTVTGTINLNGDLNPLGGVNLVVTVGFGAVPYDRFTIFNNDSNDAVSGTFKNLPEGSVIQVPGGPRLRVSYIEFHNPGSVPPTVDFYGDGNDVSLTVMTPPLLVTQSVNGDLTIDGTGWNDDLTLSFTGTNQLTLIGNDVTNFTGPLTTNVQLAGPYTVTGNITIKLGNGKDKVLIRGVGPGAAVYDSGDLTIDLGSDDDAVTTIDNALVPIISSGLQMTGSLSILGGAGLDNVTLGSLSGTDTLTALNVSVDTGTGAGNQTISLDRLTANGNVTLANGGAGAQTVAIGGTAVGVPNSILGNLIINQLASASSFTVGVHNTSVGGFVAITNGNGSGAAAVTIDTTVAPLQTIFGSTTITNGNNLSNAVTLSGFAGGLRLRGNVTVKNGAGTNFNNITVTDIVNSGTTASSFTNGSSLANTITFNGVAGATFNSFLGLVSATNGTSTGTNVINATRLSSAKGINLTNGNATTSNTVAVGGAAALDTVGVTGNLVIANGTAGTTTIGIDRLTTQGPVNSGNVTITNAATGAGGTGITFGAIEANSISGNVQITNQTSTGPRAVTMNRTTVSGRSGVNIYEVGAGDTSLTVGNNQAVTIARGLTVQDGSGASSVALLGLTAGSLTYTDLGGGTDTLDLADSAGLLRVNGVTRIDTGAGSDSVQIATTGTAMLNDTVFIALGSGNDLLFIGTHADSPAFNGASKFMFDGGTGTDIFNASPLSIAEYTGSPLGKKVKSKILNFETLLINP